MKMVGQIKDRKAFMRETHAKIKARRETIAAMDERSKKRAISKNVKRVMDISREMDNIAKACEEGRFNKSVIFLRERLWFERYQLYFSIPGRRYRRELLLKRGLEPKTWRYEVTKFKVLAKRWEMDFRYRYIQAKQNHGRRDKMTDWRWLNEPEREAGSSNRKVQTNQRHTAELAQGIYSETGDVRKKHDTG